MHYSPHQLAYFAHKLTLRAATDSMDAIAGALNRGHYLVAPFSGQFRQHADVLVLALADDLMLFGEWCAARHSVPYNLLPDWFVVFDVYDRTQGRFWSSARRDALARQVGLSPAPQLASGRLTLAQVQNELDSQPSRYREGPMEGVVIRRETAQWCEGRAKLVRADFTQTIDGHWRKRIPEWNRLAVPTGQA